MLLFLHELSKLYNKEKWAKQKQTKKQLKNKEKQRTITGPGELVHSVEYLLVKHEYLSLNLQFPHQKQAMNVGTHL